MACRSRSTEYEFESGSSRLTLKVSPGTFQTKNLSFENTSNRATLSKKVAADRKNQRSQKLLEQDHKYGLFIEIDFTQEEPPLTELQAMLKQIEKFEDTIPALLF